jgi:hypothetical protein
MGAGATEVEGMEATTGGIKATTDGMEAHGSVLASALGHFGGLIGPHDMPIRMRIRTPIRTPTPMLMRIHPWSLPQRPSSLFNPQLQHQSSRLPSTGTIVTRPKVTTPMSTSAQADGGR